MKRIDVVKALKNLRREGIGPRKLVLNEWNLPNNAVRRHGISNWAVYNRMFIEQQVKLREADNWPYTPEDIEHDLEWGTINLWLRWINRRSMWNRDDQIEFACLNSLKYHLIWQFEDKACHIIDKMFGKEPNWLCDESNFEKIYDEYGRKTGYVKLNIPESSVERQSARKVMWELPSKFFEECKGWETNLPDFFCSSRNISKNGQSVDSSFVYKNSDALVYLDIVKTPEILSELEVMEKTSDDVVAQMVEMFKNELKGLTT